MYIALRRLTVCVMCKDTFLLNVFVMITQLISNLPSASQPSQGTAREREIDTFVDTFSSARPLAFITLCDVRPETSRKE